MIGLDVPLAVVSPITDQQIAAAVGRPFNKDDIVHGGRTLGTNRGMLVVEDLLCQPGRCGPQAMRVIHYAMPAGVGCEKAGGLTQDRVVPYGLTSGPKSFCIPRILDQPKYRITRAMGVAAQPRNVQATTLGNWIAADDYPVFALNAHEQGRVSYKLEISPQGRVNSCKIIISSGNTVLDAATCRLMQRRARMLPARDGHGNPVMGAFISAFDWRLP